MNGLFGTDGVRGLANVELTPELAMALARAAAAAIAPRGSRPRFLIGKDTRASGDMLESAVAAGLSSMGVDVALAGVIPTPAAAYLIRELLLDGGVMVSASHNPFQYNGLKFLGPRGEKLSEQEEARIEELLVGELPCGEAGIAGRTSREQGLCDHYADGVRRIARTRLEGMRVVVDCAHGALWEVAPRVLNEMGAKVLALNCCPDGTNINQGGAVQPQGMAAAVRERGADAGLAFDGDGDRVVLADERGELLDGDQVLAIWAGHLHARGELANDTVVGTVITNGGLERYLSSLGCHLVRTAVGDRYVADEMRRRGAALGGETCGHIIVSRHLPSADALFVGATALGIAARTRRPLSALAGLMDKRPQANLDVPVARGTDWRSDGAVRKAVRESQLSLRDGGWLVVRASGTEPVIRVTAESEEAEEAARVVRQVAGLIEDRMGTRRELRDVEPARAV